MRRCIVGESGASSLAQLFTIALRATSETRGNVFGSTPTSHSQRAVRKKYSNSSCGELAANPSVAMSSLLVLSIVLSLLVSDTIRSPPSTVILFFVLLLLLLALLRTLDLLVAAILCLRRSNFLSCLAASSAFTRAAADAAADTAAAHLYAALSAATRRSFFAAAAAAAALSYKIEPLSN